MRILGIDYGEKRLGLAVSDATKTVAQGLETLVRTEDLEKLFGRLGEVIQKHEVSECVIGFPLHMNGTRGEKAKEAETFAELLKKRFGLPVHLWDERLTTVSVERELSRWKISVPKRKKLLDRISAQFILQSYLDSKKRP